MTRRLVGQAGVLLLTLTLAFFALRALPGDAITAQLTQSGASADAIAQRRAALGLTEPLPVQYLGYLGGLLRGDLGVSLISGQPVAELIAAALIPTLELALCALLIAVALGLLLGVVAGSGSRVGGGFARLLIVLAVSAPVYWTGIIAVAIFSVWLGWLPAGGVGGLPSLILPAATLGFQISGGIGRAVELAVREARLMDFVRTAYGKGLPRRQVWSVHILRVGMIPVVTVIALQAGFLLSGTVITEALFVRPGLGRLALDATLRRDYPIIQGVVLVSAVIYIALIALADALMPLIDPRVRQ